MPFKANSDYTLLMVGGKAAGGIFAMTDELCPSGWLSYVVVSDCAATVSKVAELGGVVVMEPKEIYKVGVIATFRDTEGPLLGLHQPVTQ
jgi:predicted enzyme related to lactoylglutathione lyase